MGIIEGGPRPPIRVGTRLAVDVETGEVTDVRRNAGTLLPPRPGTCPECAVDHPHEQPHNKDSLYYQMKFHACHGRWPTWSDAMAHCPGPVRDAWRAKLVEVHRERGWAIPADLVEAKP